MNATPLNPQARATLSVSWGRALVICLVAMFALLPATPAFAQRRVKFPPAISPPPPPIKTPPTRQNSGETTSTPPGPGPAMRQTQDRSPPPPTNLSVMAKVIYGESLTYTLPDGREMKFPQWQSFENDGFNLITNTNRRLNDGNNYGYLTRALAAPDGFDPLDLPVLYMTGDYDFKFGDAEIENLRKYILGGGTIIFNAARGRDEFSASVFDQMKRVFPTKKFVKLPLDHPVYNCKYRISNVRVLVNGNEFTQAPEVYSMDIGTRAAVILIPGGMGAAWSGQPYIEGGRHLVGESAVRLGVNLMAYILGSTEYGRFLSQEFPTYDGRTQEGDTLKLAAVVYAGSWDVNPALQNTLLQGINENTKLDVDFKPRTVSFDENAIFTYPMVCMTGHYDFKLTDKELEGLREYLTRGGVLFASSAAGFKAFDIAFRREIKRAFPQGELIKIPPTHPMFMTGWNPLERVTYTEPAKRDNPSLEYPEFWGIFVTDRPIVVFTPYDVFSGVNRENNAYARGLMPNDALRASISVITYCMTN